MQDKKLDLLVILLLVMMYCLVTFFSFLSKQYYLENLIMLSVLFATLIVAYFSGVVTALAASAVTVLFYGSYILYRNMILGANVELYVYCWMLAVPISGVVVSMISAKIRTLQETNHQLQTTFSDLVTVDTGTGLDNARVFYSISNQFIGLSRRHQIPLSLMLVRLVYFEDIEGIIGASRMQEVLKSIASQLVEYTRAEDFSYILEDGKTFAILLFSDVEGAGVVRRRIKENIHKFRVDQVNKAVEIKINLKIGIAQYDGGSADALELRQLAEKDMEYDV